MSIYIYIEQNVLCRIRNDLNILFDYSYSGISTALFQWTSNDERGTCSFQVQFAHYISIEKTYGRCIDLYIISLIDMKYRNSLGLFAF